MVRAARALRALPFRELLAPSIDYAHAGFRVTEVIGAAWSAGARMLQDAPGFAAVFMPGGAAPEVGEPFTNPALAEAYEAIADDGRDAFYDGPIARAIEQATCAAAAASSAARIFAAHRSEWVEPVSTTYRGYDVWELPPNGQGIAALQMLNILEGFDLGALGFGAARSICTRSSRRRSSRSRTARATTPIRRSRRCRSRG